LHKKAVSGPGKHSVAYRVICQRAELQWAKLLNHFCPCNYSQILTFSWLSHLLTGSPEKKKIQIESLLLAVIYLPENALGTFPFLEGENTPEKLNKNWHCVLLVVKAYLSSAPGGIKMQPCGEDKMKGEGRRVPLMLNYNRNKGKENKTKPHN
jgi:hypothetical protein